MNDATTAGRAPAPLPALSHGNLLAVGFGTAVAMWGVGYFSRLPGAELPSWLLMPMLLTVLVAGGYYVGRWTPRDWRGGAAVGLLAGTLNLLVLGSLLHSGGSRQIIPSAVWWLPGSLLVSALLASAGAAVGHHRRRMAGVKPVVSMARGGEASFATVTAAATFLLVVAGGVVTSEKAGLSVVDWPNSYGYNMFLYPLSRMTGNIYFEHVHRLLGSLTGLTTLVLAIYLQRADDRCAVRRLALVAVALVIIQGILGGLRVTGHFTMSDDPAQTHPNLILAVVHGVLGQIFFATMVTLAVVTRRDWRTIRQWNDPAANLERQGTVLLVGLLLIQLILGAVLRHFASAMYVHITMAVVVLLVGGGMGVRLLSRHYAKQPLAKLAAGLLVLLALQLLLGSAALIITILDRGTTQPSFVDVLLSTAHQTNGALLLAWAVTLALWTRHLQPSAPELSSEPLLQSSGDLSQTRPLCP